MDPNRVWRGSVTEAGCSNPSQNDNSQDTNETKINREVEIYVVVAGGGGGGGGAVPTAVVVAAAAAAWYAS